jgi:hypothetical protein
VYFLANTSNHALHGGAQFPVSDVAPSWWDPFTGKIVRAEGGNRLDFDLAPYESRVVVSSKERVGELQAVGGAPAELDLNSRWKVTFPAGAEFTEKLHAWPDPFYSGQATYEHNVTCHNPWRRVVL